MVITPFFENLPQQPKIDIDIDNLCDLKKISKTNLPYDHYKKNQTTC